MENRHLWLRSKRHISIKNILSTIIKSAREYLDGKGFSLFYTPILTTVACEGTTNLFKTDYFDSKAYLIRNDPLYNEAGAFAHGKVYSFGPTYRAEKLKNKATFNRILDD
ncbi:amino acid--tRNA ligase-related protein [Candidatus Latescibacterota bacterium]